MIKILLKKQFLELFKGYFVDRKTGKVRSKQSIIMYFVLFAVVFGLVGFSMYQIVSVMAAGFVPLGFDWLYFAFTGIMSLGIGIFGTVFTSYASLYNAKDNDFLLSMPIKPSDIIISRLASVYLLGVVYSLIAAVPSVIAYLIFADITFLKILFPVLLIPVSGVLITVVSCILSLIIAFVASKMKNKNMLTVIISFVFLGGYYFASYKINGFLNTVISDAENIERKIRPVLPLYIYGKAGSGDVLSFVLFVFFAAVCFGIVWLVMSKTFIKFSISGKSKNKKEYKDNMIKTGSVMSSLFLKEIKRFVNTPLYLMNCGLGVVFMIALSVIAVIKKDAVSGVIDNIMMSSGFDVKPMLPVIAGMFAVLLAGMDAVTAPSISLEGKTVWILKSLPVDPFYVLRSKIRLHLAVNVIPAVLSSVILSFAAGCTVIQSVAVALFVAADIWFTGTAELIINLKNPNLTWISETVPIKQDTPVIISLFGGWGVSIGAGVLYYAVHKFMSPEVYMILFGVIFASVTLFLYKWLKKTGVKLFNEL